MKPRHQSPSKSHQAIEARAALEALFGGPAVAPSANNPQQGLEGDALIAKKAADAKTISSLDFLKRKREAMDEIHREAARRGLTHDDLLLLTRE